MSISYPTSLDTLTNPVSTEVLGTTATIGIAALISNLNDIVEALEAKVGIDSSATTTTHDYKLSGVTGTDKAVSKTGTETLTNKTLTSPTLTSPTMTTPTLGVATATSYNGLTLPTTTGTFTLTNGKTLTVSDSTTLAINSITLAGGEVITFSATNALSLLTTGATVMTFPAATDTVTSIAATQTLTNKRVTKRAPAVTQHATPTINTDVTDVAHITGLAQAITSMTTNLTGTPVEGDTLRIDITDDGTARAITWGAKFEASGNVALPTTTVLSTRLDIGFIWNSVTEKWRCVAVA